jgi:hypothetical protein
MTADIKDGLASTESILAAIKFGVSIIEDQLQRTDNENAIVYLRSRATYFGAITANLNAKTKDCVSPADLSFLHNLVQSYHNARTTTTQWDAPESEHHYNAAVGTLRDDLYEMARAASSD